MSQSIERPDSESLNEIDQEIMMSEKLILIVETQKLSHDERVRIGNAFNSLCIHMAAVHKIDLLKPPVDIVMQ